MSFADELWEELQAAIDAGTEGADTLPFEAYIQRATQAISAAVCAIDDLAALVDEAIVADYSETDPLDAWRGLHSARAAAGYVEDESLPLWIAIHGLEKAGERVRKALGHDVAEPMTDDDIPF